MSEEAKFFIEAGAQRQAQKFGLTLDHVLYMARHAAVVTHPMGNRRFHDWVLNIDGAWVLSLEPFKETSAQEMARLRALSEDAIALSAGR